MTSERLLFHAGAKVRVMKGKGGPIGHGHLLAIFIKEIRVDPRSFRSKDFGPNREGVLELTVATEKTVIPFSGSGPIQEKYLRKVAYLGRNPGEIGISVGVVESDEESRRKLDKASNVASALSGSLPGAKTGWGLMIGPVAPAFGLIAGLLKFLRAGIDDDEEARVFGMVEQVVSHGDRIVAEFKRDGKEVFFVELEAEDLGEPTAQAGGFSVRISSPQIFLEDVEIGVRKGSVRQGKKGWMSRPDAGLSPVRSGDYLRRMKWFGCEAVAGIARFQYETLLADASEVLTWDKAEIFQAAAPRLKSDRHCLPLTLSFSLHPDRPELSPLTGIANAGTELVEALLEGGSDRKGREFLADIARYIRKAAPSISGLVAEISEGRFSLFSMEGFLVLMPKGQKAGRAETEGPRLMLEWDEKSGVWKGQVRSKLEWRGAVVGSFTFGLEVSEL
ncbi:MAG: hypothetical protein RL549_689 [Verrucomicrobiota bacterium]|jgi:hypothetical protein